MCGRYTVKSSIEEISDLIPGKFDYPLFAPNYNVAPSQKSLIATYAEEKYIGKMAKWGILPHWMKQKRSPFINARSETAFVKPSFRGLYKNNRCVVIADGFYEWTSIGGKKQPVYFYLKNQRPFAFAGFWQEDRESESLTFIIMTTEANEVIEQFHARMPVILEKKGIEAWLEEGNKEVLMPYNDKIQHHFVSPMVNSPKNNSEECIIPYDESD